MSSHEDDKTPKSPVAPKEGHVVEDDRGHQVWEGTIRTIKLSLMKTGIFFQSEAQQRLTKLGKGTGSDTSDDQDEELQIEEDDSGGGGFDPYDSSGK